jgi:hypothetical protein
MGRALQPNQILTCIKLIDAPSSLIYICSMVAKAKSDLPEAVLEPGTVKWLYDLANANFKAQTDLDESVWRSMSFVAALFALSVAVFRGISPHLIFHGNWTEWLAGSLYLCGIACFCVAFVFLVWIAWEREFLHPARDGDVKRYAVELTQWHRSQKGKLDAVDSKVVGDLQMFMVDLLVKANDRNLRLISRRLAGRSRSIILMLAGFALLCASEATIFVSKL